MPLDPNIVLSVKPPQVPNPLEIVSTLAQIQGQRVCVDQQPFRLDHDRFTRRPTVN